MLPMASSRARPSLAGGWYDAFRHAVRRPAMAPQLQAAADGYLLKPWTELLTVVVGSACKDYGWEFAAKAIEPGPLPVKRGEYLSIDVLAFAAGPRWRPPVAAFELENSPHDDFVGYALWKACMVRAPLACLFCYRKEPEIARLIGFLEQDVLKVLDPTNDVLIVVGTRAAAETFPDGYFRPYTYDLRRRSLRTLGLS